MQADWRALGVAGCLLLAVPGACLVLAPTPASTEQKRLTSGWNKLGSDSSDTRISACSGAHRLTASLERCVPCRLHGQTAPRLYIKESSDGAGSRLHNILAAMAFAAKHGMNLGGIISYKMCGEDHFDNGHGEDILRLVSGVLGLENPMELFVDSPPPFSREVSGVGNLISYLSTLKEKEDIVLTADFHDNLAVDLDGHDRRTADYWAPSFLVALRQPSAALAHVPLQFKSGRPSVAMHVRRGDIFLEGSASTRITPDEWYFRIVDHIQDTLGPTMRPDVHVFTSLAGKPEGSHGKRVYPLVHNVSEFDAFVSRGMTLHVDGDALEVWAHFVRADVFLMAKSEFSYVPALLSENCVVYQHYWINPLPNWIVASDGNWMRRKSKPPEFFFDQAKLDSCLDSVSDKFGR